MVGWLETVGISVLLSLQRLWEGVVGELPGVVGALLVLAIGYFVAWVVGEVVTTALTKVKLEKWVLEHTGANTYVGGLKLSHLLGTLAKWYTWILFWAQAASLVALTLLGSFIGALAIWVPKLIVAVLVSIIGFIVAEYVGSRIQETKARSGHVVAEIFKVIILVFTGITALQLLGLDVTLAQSTFLIVISGAVFALALAFGIGVGLALKDYAGEYIKTIKKKW